MEIEREDEINLLDYWRVIRKRWKIIAVTFLTPVVTAAAVSLLMIEIYQAKPLLCPSSHQKVGSLLPCGAWAPSLLWVFQA
jgi:uncharacterized protein involved in exopolysaccharide biosynthesis